MEYLNYSIEYNKININTEILKLIFILFYTYYTFLKIINCKSVGKIEIIYNAIKIMIIAICSAIIRVYAGAFNSMVFEIFLLTIICAKSSNRNMGYSILITLMTLSINRAIYFISVILSFVPNYIMSIENDYISLLIIMLIHTVILMFFLCIKKIKYGISFLQEKTKNDFTDIIILNISITTLFSIVLFSNAYRILNRSLFISIIIFIVVMFITIQKSIQLYYKQKLLEQELNTTKEKLAKTEKDLKDVENENITISKKNHTITHKQKSLNHKIEEIMAKMETSKEIGIDIKELKDRVDNLSKEINEEKVETELTKTGITEIDDMLKYMQSECSKSKIDFELQVKGNIHYMVNNLINKEDLETLIADHVRNAIIAIEHTDNINKSILVKLGKIDEIYSLYIYDSGIEFEKETLENLGKKPSTTHAEEGGTGMGFMNTFDTLRKCKASLTINEIGKPSKDDYTKVLIIKFDNKNEFNILSYREKEIIKI